MNEPKRVIPADDTLYYCDNGMILCGHHLGMSAAYTGRDISGQPIERVKKADFEYFRQQGVELRCEAELVRPSVADPRRKSA